MSGPTKSGLSVVIFAKRLPESSIVAFAPRLYRRSVADAFRAFRVNHTRILEGFQMKQHEMEIAQRQHDYDLARLKLFEIHLRHRANICYLMIGSSVTCLVAGVLMLVVGLTTEQVVWFESGELKVTAGGFGAVTMLASVAWGGAGLFSPS